MKSTFKDHMFILLPLPNGGYGGKCRVDIEYEWRPYQCKACDTFGHKEGSCKAGKETTKKSRPVNVYVPKPQKKDDQWHEVKRDKGKVVSVPIAEVRVQSAPPSKVVDDIPECSNAFTALDSLEEGEVERECVEVMEHEELEGKEDEKLRDKIQDEKDANDLLEEVGNALALQGPTAALQKVDQ